jgi:hypothetical protein
MERINIEAYSSLQRNDLLHLLEKKITENGGWVMDHRMFSNLSVNLWVVTDTMKLDKIIDEFSSIGLDLNKERIESTLLKKENGGTPENIMLTLTVNLMNSLSGNEIKIPV